MIRKLIKKEEVRVDDKVFVRKEMSKQLVPGTIIGKCERPRSFRIKLENDNVIERNKQHIYPFREVVMQALIIILQNKICIMMI